MVLVALVLIAGYQTYQLFSVKGQLTQELSGVSTTTSKVKTTATVPSNLENLPSMVGGC